MDDTRYDPRSHFEASCRFFVSKHIPFVASVTGAAYILEVSVLYLKFSSWTSGIHATYFTDFRSSELNSLLLCFYDAYVASYTTLNGSLRMS